jgi:hypothetical protein
MSKKSDFKFSASLNKLRSPQEQAQEKRHWAEAIVKHKVLPHAQAIHIPTPVEKAKHQISTKVNRVEPKKVSKPKTVEVIKKQPKKEIIEPASTKSLKTKSVKKPAKKQLKKVVAKKPKKPTAKKVAAKPRKVRKANKKV